MLNAEAQEVALLRSLLFAPGSDERKLSKALTSDADAVVADLEDAVALGQKGYARTVVARCFASRGGGRRRIVRINAPTTTLYRDDIELVRTLDLTAIILPKASPETVSALGDQGPPIIAIVETAQGLRRAYETARMERTAALALGAVDLGAELHLEPRDDGLEILFARSRLVIDSAAAEVAPPLDVVYLRVRDEVGLAREAALVRSLGFGGKFCIHPDQIAIVNDVFTRHASAWNR